MLGGGWIDGEAGERMGEQMDEEMGGWVMNGQVSGSMDGLIGE